MREMAGSMEDQYVLRIRLCRDSVTGGNTQENARTEAPRDTERLGTLNQLVQLRSVSLLTFLISLFSHYK